MNQEFSRNPQLDLAQYRDNLPTQLYESTEWLEEPHITTVHCEGVRDTDPDTGQEYWRNINHVLVKVNPQSSREEVAAGLYAIIVDVLTGESPVA